MYAALIRFCIKKDFKISKEVNFFKVAQSFHVVCPVYI